MNLFKFKTMAKDINKRKQSREHIPGDLPVKPTWWPNRTGPARPSPPFFLSSSSPRTEAARWRAPTPPWPPPACPTRCARAPATRRTKPRSNWSPVADFRSSPPSRPHRRLNIGGINPADHGFDPSLTLPETLIGGAGS